MARGVRLFAVLALLVLAIVLIALLGSMLLTYNGLVARDQQVRAQWAQVENQYQRKIDLIPQLVNVTSQYTEFERSVLENVTRLRTEWLSALTSQERVNLTNLLNGQLFLLVATFEAYPHLQSIELVAGLMDELAGTENRIAVERNRYNEAVRGYNTQVRSFPDLLWAGLFGFQEWEYYDPIPGGP